MSKVELCSTIIGKVGITTKAGEQGTVVFEDKGGIGFAEVTHEQAEQFLKIPSDYWKPGQRNATPNAVEDALANDPEAAAAAAKLLAGGKTDQPEKNVAQMVELIKLAATVDEVDALVGEDTRVGVLNAASKRKAAITEAEKQ